VVEPGSAATTAAALVSRSRRLHPQARSEPGDGDGLTWHRRSGRILGSRGGR
jgi:hypothetical protein